MSSDIAVAVKEFGEFYRVFLQPSVGASAQSCAVCGVDPSNRADYDLFRREPARERIFSQAGPSDLAGLTM